MCNPFISTIRLKTDQLEAALDSDSIYAQACALTAAFDICQAAILSLPDIVDIHADFFANLKKLRPEKFLDQGVPAAPSEYLKEMTEN